MTMPVTAASRTRQEEWLRSGRYRYWPHDGLADETGDDGEGSDDGANDGSADNTPAVVADDTGHAENESVDNRSGSRSVDNRSGPR